MSAKSCYCGSGVAFDDCCGPLLSRIRKASTAERLMRSRYSAYVVRDVDYLEYSLHPERLASHDPEGTRRWAEQAEWLGLRVVGCSGGGEEDAHGVVEFVASYRRDGRIVRHHEISTFQRVAGDWYFVEGEVLPSGVPSDAAKVGRNDPCPCGSGRKYKKCCG
ncbi:MAG TPA: YchJ family protein [Chromatiaceae bacterium]|nr:YchJ family protein [Chromatiaceae bacterium]